MKQLFTFVLAAMAFVACTQNDVEELTANRADVPETLTVGFEGGDTRIELNEALKTVWTEGDEVSVFYRSNINQRWQYQGETGERIGDLRCVDAGSGTPTETTKVVIAYPYDEAYYLNSESCNLQAMLPAVQSYKAGSYGEGGNILVSQSEYNQFSLKSVCGWLRVELTGEGQMVESITLRGNAGEQVAGELYINTATAEATLASERGEAGEAAGGSLIFDDTMFMEVTLDCGEGVELGAEATEFYIALPPQTFAEGMTIEVNYANGNSQPLVCENSITISRNHISPINIEASEEEDVVNSQIFYTATALVEPYNTSAFNVAIVSNEWDEATGEYVITFDGELTTIVDSAFEGCSSLTSVTIPDSVTTIGENAFYYCESLTSVTIPDSVTTIGDQAFYFCESLTSVTIGDSVTTIGDYAFYGCSLTSVTIGDSVTSIGDEAFYDCYYLTSVYCKATTPPSLGYNAFKYYDNGDVNIGCSIYVPVKSVEAYKAATNWSEYADHIVEYDFNSTMTISYTTSDGMPANASGLIIGNSYQNGVGELTYIGKDIIPAVLFRNCDNLTSVTIPDSVTTIGDRAFYFCSRLTSVTIGNSVTTIGDYAFSHCGNLTSVTIPDSVTTIGDEAFAYCYYLTSVTIGNSVTTIGDEAFAYCYYLTSVYCKATTPPTLDDGAFYNSASGSKIYVPVESVEAYKAAENWSEYADHIVEYDYSSTMTISYTTSDGMPANANGLIVSNSSQNGVGELIYIGKDIIPALLFRNCHNLTSVTIPDSVTTIGDRAFYNCDSLTSVTIPDSVTTIGASAFYNCDSLTGVYCEATTTPTLEGSSVFDDNASGRKIYVPATSVEAYKAATNWSDYAADIVGYDYNSVVTISYTTSDGMPVDARAPIVSNSYQNGVGELIYIGKDIIPEYLFYNCDNLTSVTIPDSVTTIGGYAFYNCDSLTSVTIPDSVTTIGYAAFSSCHSLTSVTIGDSVTTIGGSAFYFCYSLTSVTIPDSVTTIGDSAFIGCSSLTSVTIPDSVTTIGNYAFHLCSSLTSITIPDSVTTIGDGVFAYCYRLSEFKGKYAADGGRCLIKDNTLIAYANASGTTYTIPDSVTTIGEAVFYGCGLTSVTIPDSVTSIGDYAFYYCDSLTSVTIGDSVTTIGDYAFWYCDNLTSVTIPDSVTTIGKAAFWYCSSLTSVYCEATTPPTLDGSSIFNNNASGRKIYVPAESVEAYKAAENWSEYAAKIVGYDFETGKVAE